jgi:hypothetical protein
VDESAHYKHVHAVGTCKKEQEGHQDFEQQQRYSMLELCQYKFPIAALNDSGLHAQLNLQGHLLAAAKTPCDYTIAAHSLTSFTQTLTYEFNHSHVL